MKDNCERCHGERGGARGNENIIDGWVLCDYCSCDSRPTRAEVLEKARSRACSPSRTSEEARLRSSLAAVLEGRG